MKSLCFQKWLKRLNDKESNFWRGSLTLSKITLSKFTLSKLFWHNIYNYYKQSDFLLFLNLKKSFFQSDEQRIFLIVNKVIFWKNKIWCSDWLSVFFLLPAVRYSPFQMCNNFNSKKIPKFCRGNVQNIE